MLLEAGCLKALLPSYSHCCFIFEKYLFGECFDLFLAVFGILSWLMWCTFVSFLAYSVEEQKNLTSCPDGAPFIQHGPDYRACQFPVSLLEECSGVTDANFGYSKGQPCILVKMNRVRTCFLSAAACLTGCTCGAAAFLCCACGEACLSVISLGQLKRLAVLLNAMTKRFIVQW